MQFKELANQLASESAETLEGTVLERAGKKGQRQINTFVLRTETSPPRTLYRKNLRVEPGVFLESEVPAAILQNIKQKLVRPN
jgi:hypothetical protein